MSVLGITPEKNRNVLRKVTKKGLPALLEAARIKNDEAASRILERYAVDNTGEDMLKEGLKYHEACQSKYILVHKKISLLLLQ